MTTELTKEERMGDETHPAEEEDVEISPEAAPQEPTTNTPPHEESQGPSQRAVWLCRLVFAVIVVVGVAVGLALGLGRDDDQPNTPSEDGFMCYEYSDEFSTCVVDNLQEFQESTVLSSTFASYFQKVYENIDCSSGFCVVPGYPFAKTELEAFQNACLVDEKGDFFQTVNDVNLLCKDDNYPDGAYLHFSFMCATAGSCDYWTGYCEDRFGESMTDEKLEEYTIEFMKLWGVSCAQESADWDACFSQNLYQYQEEPTLVETFTELFTAVYGQISCPEGGAGLCETPSIAGNQQLQGLLTSFTEACQTVGGETLIAPDIELVCTDSNFPQGVALNWGVMCSTAHGYGCGELNKDVVAAYDIVFLGSVNPPLECTRIK